MAIHGSVTPRDPKWGSRWEHYTPAVFSKLAGALLFVIAVFRIAAASVLVVLIPVLSAIIVLAGLYIGNAMVRSLGTQGIPCTTYAPTFLDAAYFILGLTVAYAAMLFLTWLVMQANTAGDKSYPPLVRWSSGLVLTVATAGTLLLFVGPVLLHDGSIAINAAGKCWGFLIDLRGGFAAHYWVPIVLGFLVACAYLYAPRSDRFYREIIFPRRTVWCVFGIVVASTVWLTSALGIDLQNRVQSAQPLLYHATFTAHALQTELEKSDYAPVAAYLGVARLNRDIAELQTALAASTGEEHEGSADGSEQAVAGNGEVDILKISIDNLALLANQLAAEQRKDPRIRTPDDTELRLMHQRSLLRTITNTLHDLNDVSTLPYFTVAVLYSTFLLLPWIIFIVYVTSRRSKVTSQTVEDLRRFGLLRAVCEPQPSDGTDLLLAKMWAKATPQREDLQGKNLWAARRVFSVGVFARLYGPRRDSGEDLDRDVKRDAYQFIVGRAQFYSLQYLIPLGLLSIVSAIGWYYTFLAGTLTSLYAFIRGGGSTLLLNSLLTSNVTVFTAAFLGGWIFVIVMLLNSWTRDDLYPRTYFYAAVHLMIAMIVGFVFAVALNAAGNDWLTVPAMLAALLISIVPYDSVGLFTQKWLDYIGDIFKRGPKTPAEPPDPQQGPGAGTAPLSPWVSHELQQALGISIWDETKLHQEGINSTRDLAYADLARLVLQTQYSAGRLAQWIDALLLRQHAGSEDIIALAQKGIMTATDLLVACSTTEELDKLTTDLKPCDDQTAAEGHSTKTGSGKVLLQYVKKLQQNAQPGAVDPATDAAAALIKAHPGLLNALALEPNFGFVFRYRTDTA
jgi:hypothetical protein